MGARTYFLVKRRWQRMPQRAALAPRCNSQLCKCVCKHVGSVWETYGGYSRMRAQGSSPNTSAFFLKVKATELYINPTHIFIQVPKTQNGKTRLATPSRGRYSKRDAAVGVPCLCVHTTLISFLCLPVDPQHMCMHVCAHSHHATLR